MRCTHGATSGQVNEDELFYMLARGIRPRDARRLIVLGFLSTVLERLPQEALRAYLSGKIARKLSR